MTEDGRCWRALPHSPSARSAVSPAWREAASALRAGTVRGGHFFTPSHKQHPRHTANEKKRQRPEVQTRETESRPSSVLHMHSGHLLPLRSWDSQPGSGGRGSVRLAWPSRIPAESQQNPSRCWVWGYRTPPAGGAKESQALAQKESRARSQKKEAPWVPHRWGWSQILIPPGLGPAALPALPQLYLALGPAPSTRPSLFS